MAERHLKRSVTLGDDLDLAAFPISHAFGTDAVSFAQIEVYHPAIRWRHGFQGDTASGLNDAVGNPVSHFPEGVLPAPSVLFDIQRDADVLIELLTHDALHDELQRLQGVASAPDEQPGVRALNVDNGPPGEFVMFRTKGNLNFCADDAQDPFDRLDSQIRRGFGSQANHRLGFGRVNRDFVRWLVFGIIVVVSVVFR